MTTTSPDRNSVPGTGWHIAADRIRAHLRPRRSSPPPTSGLGVGGAAESLVAWLFSRVRPRRPLRRFLPVLVLASSNQHCHSPPWWVAGSGIQGSARLASIFHSVQKIFPPPISAVPAGWSVSLLGLGPVVTGAYSRHRCRCWSASACWYWALPYRSADAGAAARSAGRRRYPGTSWPDWRRWSAARPALSEHRLRSAMRSPDIGQIFRPALTNVRIRPPSA